MNSRRSSPRWRSRVCSIACSSQYWNNSGETADECRSGVLLPRRVVPRRQQTAEQLEIGPRRGHHLRDVGAEIEHRAGEPRIGERHSVVDALAAMAVRREFDRRIEAELLGISMPRRQRSDDIDVADPGLAALVAPQRQRRRRIGNQRDLVDQHQRLAVDPDVAPIAHQRNKRADERAAILRRIVLRDQHVLLRGHPSAASSSRSPSRRRTGNRACPMRRISSSGRSSSRLPLNQ